MAITKTRNTLITQALRMCGAVAEDESPSSAMIQDGAIRLDWMVKTIQATGAHLWKLDEATLFLTAGQAKYVLGTGSTEHVTTSFTETTLSADEAIGETTLSMTATTDAVIGDYVGVTQDDNTIHWSTISTVAPFVIADALTVAAASGNAVVYYTTNIGKPLRIPDARRRQSSQDIEMVHMGRKDYLNLPTKTTQGTPTQYYYKPNVDSGELFIWNTAQNAATQRVLFSFYDPIDVFATSASAADFPSEWMETLLYNLAVRLAPDFGQPLPAIVVQKAETLMKNSLEWDNEDSPLYFAYSDRGD